MTIKSNLEFKRSKRQRKGVVLLIVLCLIITIMILSLEYVTQSDVELSSGRNMAMRIQMDYLADSAIEHARGLLLNPEDVDLGGDEYWTGALRQQLVTGNDYYDISIVKDDVNSTTEWLYYSINCSAYREQGGEKVGQRDLSAVLRIFAEASPMIGWWKLDEASGLTAADSSGNGNDGTLTNMNGDEWITGQVDGALEFDGNNDYIDVSSLSATLDKTFSCWIYIDSLYDSYHTLIEFENDRPWFGLAEWSGNWYLLEYRKSCWGSTSLSTGRWYHIAYTSDIGTNSSKVYLDGVEDTFSAVNANTQTGTGMGIAYLSGDTPFDGKIDDVRVYDFALTDNEVNSIANGN